MKTSIEINNVSFIKNLFTIAEYIYISPKNYYLYFIRTIMIFFIVFLFLAIIN